MEEWGLSTQGWLKYRIKEEIHFSDNSVAGKEGRVQSVLTKWFHSKTMVQDEGESDE